jgi:aerotaxis receptor
MPSIPFVRDIETLVPEHTLIYSQTDLQGRITSVNDSFIQLSGYSQEELMGKPHNMVRHPDMPKEAFADLWKSLKEGRPWRGLVKNRRKDGGYYWVAATVSPLRKNGRIVGYQSHRQRPERAQVAAAANAYKLIQSGNSSLRIDQGRALSARSLLSARWRRYDFQIALAGIFPVVTLAVGALAWATDFPLVLRFLLGGLVGLSGLHALYMLLGFLPALKGYLRKLEEHLDTVLGSGNLKLLCTAQREDAIGEIGHKQALLQAWMQSSVHCIDDALGQVRSSTAEILKAIQEINQAANSQNNSTSSVAAATTELGLTIREVSQHLHETETLMGSSGQKATEGAGVSARASEEIQRLATAIQAASGSVEALGKSSSEVGAIAGAIREIADQTNLLALNASIEAARAGEAGRGFAVVANEVRRLADRTTQATAHIDSLLQKIKNDSDRAIEGMRNGSSQVQDGLNMVVEAKESLDGINVLIGDAVRRVTEIATASSQQTEAMNDIGQNISQVAAMTEQSLSAVQHTTSKIEILAPMVERVKEAVDQFSV